MNAFISKADLHRQHYRRIFQLPLPPFSETQPIFSLLTPENCQKIKRILRLIDHNKGSVVPVSCSVFATSELVLADVDVFKFPGILFSHLPRRRWRASRTGADTRVARLLGLSALIYSVVSSAPHRPPRI